MYKYDYVDTSKLQASFTVNKKDAPHGAGRTAETLKTAALIIAVFVWGYVSHLAGCSL